MKRFSRILIALFAAAAAIAWCLVPVGIACLLGFFISTIEAQNTSTPSAPLIIPPGSYSDEVSKGIEAMNVPITFYGIVVDQDGNALSGVKLVLRIQQPYFDPIYVAKANYIHLERTTGSDGRFNLEGATGKGLDIESISKSGYELEPDAKHVYGPVSGSLDNPVILRMWNTNIHEKLIVGAKRFHIESDGRLYIIDLMKGAIAESGEGDLKLWIRYNKNVPNNRTNDWSCGIDVLNGGLLEENRSDCSMYSAPTIGYTSTFRLDQQIRRGQRGSIGKRRFYLRLKNGQEYGRAIINLVAPYNDHTPGLVDIHYAINPSGSRILRQ